MAKFGRFGIVASCARFRRVQDWLLGEWNAFATTLRAADNERSFDAASLSFVVKTLTANSDAARCQVTAREGCRRSGLTSQKARSAALWPTSRTTHFDFTFDFYGLFMDLQTLFTAYSRTHLSIISLVFWGVRFVFAYLLVLLDCMSYVCTRICACESAVYSVCVCMFVGDVGPWPLLPFSFTFRYLAMLRVPCIDQNKK